MQEGTFFLLYRQRLSGSEWVAYPNGCLDVFSGWCPLLVSKIGFKSQYLDYNI